MLSRRHLLSTAAAFTAWASLPATARAAVSVVPAATGEAAKLNALMEVFFQENLRQGPEQATALGLDTGANADLRSKLSDNSAAGIEKSRALVRDQQRRLKELDVNALSGMDRVNYETIDYTLESRRRIGEFDFGGSGFGASPYVVSQQTGAYQSVPNLLDTNHKIENPADADAYLARLDAFAVQIRNNIDRMKHDAALGVVPPDFILDTTLKQMVAMRTPAKDALVITSLEKRVKEKSLPGRYVADASRIYDEKVGPAMDALIEQTKAMRATATSDAGVWKVKGGAAYYAAGLRASTTTSMSPEEIHKLGLDQGAEITARIDTLLKAQGMNRGTVGERIKALYDDPQHFFPDTDAGKAEAIVYCNDQLDKIRPALPRVFKRLPPYTFEIRRVPAALEPGAASARAQAPSLDGSRPGIVWFNFRDSKEWPKWSLPSVTFHEALPGHQFEGGLALSSNLPLLRKTTGFASYAEGWALYSEQLADEIGMYDDNPLGRIGYLRFQLFRAIRCVADTGIHHMRWSKDRAIQAFVDGEGDAPGFATREVERYCVNPGQACSYKIGHTVWVRARERAKTALGGRYDIKDFHAAGLDCGRVPLDVLDGVIDRWVASAQA